MSSNKPALNTMNVINDSGTAARRIETGPYAGFDVTSVRAEFALVTPEEARILRDTCHFSRQRAIRADNVNRLLSEAIRGTFIPGTPVFICVLPDGSMRIANGNHTLEMAASLGHPVPLTLIYAKVKDEKETGRIYATFDLHKMRSWMDALRAQEKSELGDIPLASHVLSALGYIIGGFTGGGSGTARLSRGLRFDMMEEYRGAAELLSTAMRGAPNTRKILRGSVFSVALATTRYQPSAGADFWGGMAHDNGLISDDPRKALLRYITNNNHHGGGAQTENCRAAILAWNAAFKNESLSVCKPNATKSFRILGTPFGEDNVSQPKGVKSAAVPVADKKAEDKTNGRLFAIGYDSDMRPATIYQG
jgi:hypothetical protein